MHAYYVCLLFFIGNVPIFLLDLSVKFNGEVNKMKKVIICLTSAIVTIALYLRHHEKGFYDVK